MLVFLLKSKGRKSSPVLGEGLPVPPTTPAGEGSCLTLFMDSDVTSSRVTLGQTSGRPLAQLSRRVKADGHSTLPACGRAGGAGLGQRWPEPEPARKRGWLGENQPEVELRVAGGVNGV